MSDFFDVLITVTNETTNDNYLSRSYPDDDYNNNGLTELYSTPVYNINITRLTLSSSGQTIAWKCLRFMPYWNDPKNHYPQYKTEGWVNAGLHYVPKKRVARYDPHYGTQNRYSDYSGAIQIRDSFLIHAGPDDFSSTHEGWGSAGCVEIIGNFRLFKTDIAIMSGSNSMDIDGVLSELVSKGKLFVEVQYATPPDFRKRLKKEKLF